VNAPVDVQAIKRRIRDAMLILGYRHPQFLLLWDRVRERVVVDGARASTMAVDASGTIYVSPEFVARLSSAELAGVVAHELLHLVFAHHTRIGGRDAETWNLAGDACINGALREDGITLPAGAYYAPADYTGTLQAEPLYDFLIARTPKTGGKGKPGRESPEVGQGCGVIPVPDDAPEPDASNEGGTPGALPSALREGETWEDVRELVDATCAQIGAGSSAVRRLLRPAPARTDWRALLRQGVTIAQGATVRDTPTFSRPSRRNVPGVIRAGWTPSRPSVAVVIDVSGSMDRKWVERVVAECESLIRTFPGLRVFVATHTSRCEWQGWIGENDAQAWEEATGHTGGTDPREAFRAVEATGKPFGACIHFTDCELDAWGRAENARRHLIGACGAGADGRPFIPFPPWADVVPVDGTGTR
jgi:predicted metal-dependent peptidase